MEIKNPPLRNQSGGILNGLAMAGVDVPGVRCFFFVSRRCEYVARCDDLLRIASTFTGDFEECSVLAFVHIVP
jgi:hypothetical protein